ncbi:hypothetical protein EYF80_053598 [Liparis tanakae]|uniref:Uncharacterized protein n=1 Tax=Liparis tanakae TaxID=230148 RepID=A0A4Z2F646_9TELE|nr:hypothetical protein EYF80_053598 [Liparis tanakae]
MRLNRLHAAALASGPGPGPGPGPVRTREEGGEARTHQRARRASSDDNSRCRSAVPENRIGTIPELTESLERRLLLRDQRTTTQNDEKTSLLRPEDVKKSGGGGQHRSHRCHQEGTQAARRPEGRSAHSEACQARRLWDERRRSADGPMEREELTAQRQLSLRRQR